MSLQNLLFLGGFGVRTTTIAMAVLLIAVGAGTRRPWKGLLAALAWFFVFEVVYDALNWTLHGGPIPPGLGWFTAPVAFAVAYAAGCRLHRSAAAAALGLLLIWIAVGFHSNGHTMVGFSPLNEALNEGVKVAWGLAYLIPLVREGPLGAQRMERSYPGTIERGGVGSSGGQGAPAMSAPVASFCDRL